METYREKLKVQNVIYCVGCIVLAAFCVLSFLGEAGIVNFAPSAENSHWQSAWRGLLSGASISILAALLFGLIQNLRALKDEKKLKKMYIQEGDERQKQIYTNALCAAMRASLVLGLVAVVVAGYFSMTVSVTLLAAVFVNALLAVAFKLYFRKKY